jgi:hypothetical protein
MALMRLACIAHKSLEIRERCRLWQQNSPAAPKNSTAFWREEFKHFVSIHLFAKPAQHHIPSQPGSAQDWSPPGYRAGLPNPQ